MIFEKKQRLISLICIALCAVFTLSCSDDDDNSSPTGPSGETSALQFGALFTFEESGPVHGQSMLAALETAEEEINAYFSDTKTSTRVEFIAKDTEGSVENLLAGFNEMVDDGITVFFAPLTSFEIEVLMSAAEGKDVLFISPTSTSTDLSLDDNLIRLLPDDTVQASTMVDVIAADGIKKLVTLYRSDLWGIKLAADVESAFSAGGGVVEATLTYSARIPEIDLETVMAQTAEAVTNALETTDAAEVAVHISCFEEGVAYLKEASKYADLAKVKWYSADGFAKNSELFTDSEAAAFAAATGLSASQFGEPTNADYTEKQDEIAEKTGTTPYSFAMLLYDTAWIVAKSADDVDLNDTAAFKAKLIEIAESHEGLFGKAKMDENGDRANGSYDLWKVTGSDGSYSWEKSTTYQVGE